MTNSNNADMNIPVGQCLCSILIFLPLRMLVHTVLLFLCCSCYTSTLFSLMVVLIYIRTNVAKGPLNSTDLSTLVISCLLADSCSSRWGLVLHAWCAHCLTWSCLSVTDGLNVEQVWSSRRVTRVFS